jgi:hypothetical protein
MAWLPILMKLAADLRAHDARAAWADFKALIDALIGTPIVTGELKMVHAMSLASPAMPFANPEAAADEIESFCSMHGDAVGKINWQNLFAIIVKVLPIILSLFG